ncbi:ABC transporter substrate-binding protein [Tardiphaga sp. 172_B4_N1_3]|uniref:ABC transporter substrate-binding protein n=1 Tax=Tardiphaga sp. 172_B4_N1_3 TaxID=3240787 RepID=UPI003F8B1D17
MTKDRSLSLAVWRYDRTEAFYDGRVGISGYDLELIDAPLEELFSRAFVGGEFDLAELSFSNFLRFSMAGKCPYLGLPIFPSRSFRHGVFYVRDDGRICEPADLIGRKVGLREYSMTAALAARGALRDHYGITSDQIKWVMGDVDKRERDEIVLPQLFKEMPIEIAPDGVLLRDMLRDGRIDAILAYKPIDDFQAGNGVRRLIADHARAEADYFRATGVFPIMHLVGIRRDIASADPGLAERVVGAFEEAQRLANENLWTEQALKISLPWVGEELRRTVEIMGSDYWPSGLEKNRAVIERMTEWSYEDGLIPRRPMPEELFVSDTL